MPKWISVEKAVIKYHIEKEAILLWVEMGQFPMLYIDNVPNVDEECILELFRRSKAGITAEYIDTLEQLCIDKTMLTEKSDRSSKETAGRQLYRVFSGSTERSNHKCRRCTCKPGQDRR